MNEEGWYVDPFGRHEARWMSAGTPTSLVRDEGIEGQDPPSGTPIAEEMVPWAPGPAAGGDDLKRADDVERRVLDPNAMTEQAEEAIDSATGF